MSSKQNEEIMDEVYEVIRINHYSIHTKRSYCDWIRGYIFFVKRDYRKISMEEK
ncbi:MAG: phage integrase N-terminal SAM-like domain-containing protein [Desulfamplus sp.]